MDYSFEQITFYLIFILPGLISLKIYGLLLPTVKKSVSEYMFDSLFYACINILILLPVFILLINYEDYLGGWFYVIIYSLMLTVSIGFPFFTNYLFTKTRLLDKFQLPFPTAWDYFFNQRETCFILFHLKDGSKIAGYYGKNSFACAFPKHGDIYVELVYQLDKDGKFGGPIKDSKGLLISKEEYSFIEIFQTPTN